MNIQTKEAHKLYIENIEVLLEREDILVEPLRARKIESARTEDKKKELLASDRLLRLALEEYIDIHEPIVLEYQCYGKPYLENRVSYFNLSHAKDYVICATSHEDMGVDMKYIRP